MEEIDDVEAVARLIDPEVWVDKQPIPDAFNNPEDQERYERFFSEAVVAHRGPSLLAARRVLESDWFIERMTRWVKEW